MGKKKVMLVLDDETGILGIFEELLGEDYEIHCCKNIEEGLDALKENRPEIMFLDYLVNGEIGLDLIDKVKEEKLETAWAVMTSYKRMISDKDLDKMGECPIIEKPFKLELLRETLEDILKKEKK
ncbi:MAG: response regulator [Bdellovibrionota bacterium]|nr:response regulator [Bdellovibrionota bacterium]